MSMEIHSLSQQLLQYELHYESEFKSEGILNDNSSIIGLLRVSPGL